MAAPIKGIFKIQISLMLPLHTRIKRPKIVQVYKLYVKEDSLKILRNQQFLWENCWNSQKPIKFHIFKHFFIYWPNVPCMETLPSISYKWFQTYRSESLTKVCKKLTYLNKNLCISENDLKKITRNSYISLLLFLVVHILSIGEYPR